MSSSYTWNLRIKRTSEGLRKQQQKGKTIKKNPKGYSRRSKDLSQFTNAKVKRKNWRCLPRKGLCLVRRNLSPINSHGEPGYSEISTLSPK